jgi:DNA-binding transcriptional ArsR family regulator
MSGVSGRGEEDFCAFEHVCYRVAPASDPADSTALSPDEAFSVLGNETRVRMLQTLGEAAGPLSFTELRDRVGIRQGAQFNYHLDKLVGHFVAKTDDGYALRQAGRRVVEAVLSGAITDDPTVERTEVEAWPCPYCGAPSEVAFREERVERYCTDCPGLYDAAAARMRPDFEGEYGDLGALELPPAGVQGRSAEEILWAAFTWSYAEWLVAANDVCPRCSATVDRSVTVCECHDTDASICDRCGRRQAVAFRVECENCNFSRGSIVSMHLAASTELLAFLTARGVAPLSDPWDWGWEYDEEIRSTDPFAGRFTFTVDGDSITLTVDDDLDVIDAERG